MGDVDGIPMGSLEGPPVGWSVGVVEGTLESDSVGDADGVMIGDELEE